MCWGDNMLVCEPLLAQLIDSFILLGLKLLKMNE